MEVPEDWLERHYDLLVVGGGINGAAIARDAARRGLSVLLLEGEDWGWGTSAKSSRLAHGGLRYLELMEFGLVHEALQERERLLRQAPHLVRPLRFLYPLYPDIVARRVMRVGLWFYDLLSHGRSVPGRDFLDAEAALREAPALEPRKLKGAAAFYDARIDHVERLVIEAVADAHAHGAVVRNHTPVVRLHVDGAGRHRRCTGAVVRVGGEESLVRASAVINATGAWVDALVASLGPAAPAKPLVRTTKGIHFAVPRFMDVALIVRAKDGRTFFILPWHDTCYVGTTDTDYEGDPGDAAATAQEVRYLQQSAARYVPDAPLQEVLYTWAGVRALVNEEGLTESNVTRRHLVQDHARDGVPGLWTLQGGKITTARSLAEEVVDRVAKAAGLRATAALHPTRDAPLPGGVGIGPWGAFRAHALEEARREGLPPDVAAHLIDAYGSRWRAVATCDGRPGARSRVVDDGPHILAEVTWAVRHEQARTVSDVMMRRTTLAQAPAGDPSAAAAVAKWMGDLLGWSRLATRAQSRRYRDECRVLAVPTGAAEPMLTAAPIPGPQT